MDDLPSEFDVIVVGTGLTESVVSAAVARNGHSVLHIDPRDYYGGKWATLAWDNWASGNFSRKPELLQTKEGNLVGTFEGRTGDKNCIVWTNDVRELEQTWYTPQESVKAEVSYLSRKFNIDISPKVLMAREETIQLLIQSNVSRYLEFSCIKKLMSTLPAPNDTVIESIPLCRSDIFTTKTISLIEKRKLMKFIEFVLQPSNGNRSSASGNDYETDPFSPSTSKSAISAESGSKTFEELARIHHLSAKVKHLIQSAVRTMDDCMEMTSDEVPDGEDSFNIKFTENCRLFLQSINRYGNQTPFLWTLYGISEICQAFCRLSAIYGGIFILKQAIESISEDKEDPNHVTITSEGTELKAKYVVLGPELKIFNGRKVKSPKCRHGITVVRGVLLVTGPRLKPEVTPTPTNAGSGHGQLTVYRLGDMDVMELDESSVAAPKNYRLLHVTTPHRSYTEGCPTPREIVEARLAPFVQFQNPPTTSDKVEEMETEEVRPDARVVEGRPMIETPEPVATASAALSKPLVLHGSYFLLDFYEDIKDEDCESPRIISCATSSSELTNHVQKARDIFQQMYPTEDFLPKAPDAPEPNFDDEFEPEDDINGEVENHEGAHLVPVPEMEDLVPIHEPEPEPEPMPVQHYLVNGYGGIGLDPDNENMEAQNNAHEMNGNNVV